MAQAVVCSLCRGRRGRSLFRYLRQSLYLLAFAVFTVGAQAEPEADRRAACYEVYDEARPLLTEDFSLRLFRSGNGLSLTERENIEARNDQNRLAGTILSGGSMSLRAYNDLLKEKTAACDAELLIPQSAIRLASENRECAVHYAAIAELSKMALQRNSFLERSEMAVEIGAFISKSQGVGIPQLSRAARAEGIDRAEEVLSAEGGLSNDSLLDLIFEVQTCDAKYGHSLMLVPGNFSQMFGRRSE